MSGCDSCCILIDLSQKIHFLCIILISLKSDYLTTADIKMYKYLFLTGILAILLMGCKKEKQLPVVEFSFENFQEFPALIVFENNTELADSYSWDFGNGNISKMEEPSILYNIPGRYSVELTAHNNDGSSSLTKTITISGKMIMIQNNIDSNLNGVYAYYWNGTEYTDSYDVGSLAVWEYSIPIGWNSPAVYIGWQLDENIYFEVAQPFDVFPNQVTEILLYGNVEGYIFQIENKNSGFTCIQNRTYLQSSKVSVANLPEISGK